MEKHILSAIVKNNSGVLARVSSLFGRRGYNIDSLTVSPTINPKISRITIVVTGDDAVLEQVRKQVLKLEETISLEHLPEGKCHCREFVFVKIDAIDASSLQSAREVAEVYGAHITFSQGNIIILELADAPSRIDAFLSVIASFNVVETCRSGVTAMM